jgi:predicted permease
LEDQTQPVGQILRLFFDCLKNFIIRESSCKEDPIVLILNYHEFHMLIPAINVRKEDGILYLTLSLVHTKQITLFALKTERSQTKPNL